MTPSVSEYQYHIRGDIPVVGCSPSKRVQRKDRSLKVTVRKVRARGDYVGHLTRDGASDWLNVAFSGHNKVRRVGLNEDHHHPLSHRLGQNTTLPLATAGSDIWVHAHVDANLLDALQYRGVRCTPEEFRERLFGLCFIARVQPGLAQALSALSDTVLTS